MKTKQYAALAIIAMAAGAFLALNPPAQSAAGKSYKLEGAWTASVPGTPVHWSYVIAPTDPSGKTAVVKGEFVVPIPTAFMFPELADQEYVTEFYGEAEMVGNDTVKFTIMWYGMKSDVPFPQIVNIGVDVGEARFVAQDKLEFTSRMAWYLPNETGIVTADDTPFLVYPDVVRSIDTRMSIIPASALAR